MNQQQHEDLHADPGLGPGLRVAKAQAPPATTAQRPEERSQEFVPVTGGQDTASASTLLVGAYLVMWALLLGFLLLGWRRSQRIEARLHRLEEVLDRHDTEGGKAA